MGSFRICDGVNWETVEISTGAAAFHESAFEDPSLEVLLAVLKRVDIDALNGMKAEYLGGGISGSVYSLREAEHVAVKFHSEPFSSTAVGASLEVGLPKITDTDLDLRTPNYMAFITDEVPDADGFPRAATVMSRVVGESLGYLPTTERWMFPMSEEWREIIRVGQNALGAVGIGPGVAMWGDLKAEHLITEQRVSSIHEALQGPVTILDVSSWEWANRLRLGRQEF